MVLEIPEPTDPLPFDTAIVDENGNPTPYFQRQWASQQIVNNSSEAIAAAVIVLQDAVAALQALILTAGTGLDGGGDLTADRQFDLEDTAVTPDQYGDETNVAQITIDAQGRITAAVNVPVSGGGGGGGSIAQFAAEQASGFSGSAWPTKGAIETFFKDVALTSINVRIDATSGHTYVANVYEIDSSGVIQAITASSSEIVAGSTAPQLFQFPITATLVAGTRYFLAVRRTDGGDSFALRIPGTSISADVMAFPAFPTVPYAESSLSTFGRIAQAVPAVSDTINIGVDAFAVGIEGSY